MKQAQYKRLLKKASRSQFKTRSPKVRSLPVFGRMGLTRAQETQLDTIWAKAVKKVAGDKCEKCFTQETLQSHHVIGRRNKTLRHIVSNGCSLCAKHHMWAEQHGVSFAQWIIGQRGQKWFDDLEAYGREVKVFKEYSIVKAYIESFL